MKPTTAMSIAEELERAAHNAGAERVREAMAAAGWVNPDGQGYIYYHPDICDADGKPIPMLAYTAEPIQRLRDKEAAKDAP